MPPPQAVKIFCSYAHKDEPLREALDPHFALLRRKGVATFWSDKEIYAGSDWASQIDDNLRAANIIILLLSANFINSEYCSKVEMAQAAARHLRGEAIVIPVILRPCEWDDPDLSCEGGKFVLSRLQVLPVGARPVTKWGNRDEAYHNIAKGVAAVVEQFASGAATWGETTVALPARAAAPAPPVPELLPYLCDRATQETLLHRAVHKWRARGLVKRPLVCVVHGGDDEAIDMFKRRLHEVTLPALLSARAEGDGETLYDPALGRIDDQFIELPPFIESGEPFDYLQEKVGRAVADYMYASPEAVAEALSAKDTPTLFHSHLASSDWGGDGERIVDAFFKFWGSLPDVKAGRVLSFLFFKYSVGAAGGSARLAELNARAEAFFDGLGARLSAFEGAHAVVLPRLPSVALGDAATWVRSREHFRNLCRNHPLYFCNVERAVEEIEQIYEDPLMSIPLERLAPRLHAVITNHRCGAASPAA